MNGSQLVDPKVKSRRLLVRGGLVIVYLLLIAIVYVFGKGHTLLLDNKDSEDGSVKAFENVTVTVDNQDPIDFMSGDRDQAKLQAQWHKVKVEVNGQTVEKKIKLPVGENMLLLSIPKFVAGIEPAIIPFVPKEEPAPPAEDTSSTETSSSDQTAAPAASGAPQQTPPAP